MYRVVRSGRARCFKKILQNNPNRPKAEAFLCNNVFLSNSLLLFFMFYRLNLGIFPKLGRINPKWYFICLKSVFLSNGPLVFCGVTQR